MDAVQFGDLFGGNLVEFSCIPVFLSFFIYFIWYFLSSFYFCFFLVILLLLLPLHYINVFPSRPSSRYLLVFYFVFSLFFSFFLLTCLIIYHNLARTLTRRKINALGNRIHEHRRHYKEICTHQHGNVITQTRWILVYHFWIMYWICTMEWICFFFAVGMKIVASYSYKYRHIFSVYWKKNGGDKW